MENIFKINNLMVFVFLIVLSGCTKNFDELNTDPNAISAAELDGSFAGPAFANALYKGLHHGSNTGSSDDHGTYGLITMLHSMVFVHFQSVTDVGWPTERNGVNDGWRARGWTRFYSLAVPSLNTAYKASEGNAEAIAILDIWKVYMYHKMTDHFGPIPYFEAGKGGESVPYDSQESMYNDFFTLLDNANNTLGTSSGSVGIFQSFDRVFDGNIQKWKKFGNSLRLRLALRISDIDPSNAKIQAESAVAAGVMESNADNALFAVSDATDNNFNKITGRSGWGFAMSASMESILKGYSDPRLPVWFTPSVNGGSFTGQPNGGGAVRNWTRDDVASTNDAIWGSDLRTSKAIEIITTAEIYFNRSEGAINGWNMGGDTAKSYYEQGIQMSMGQWGIADATAISNYISGVSTPVVPDLAAEYTAVGLSTTPPVSVPVSWAATINEQRTQITVQKYLALFPEGSWEAWADLRRTDAEILYPLLNTENTDTNVGRGLMKRVPYLPNEYSTNNAEVLKAVNTIGGQDTGGAKLWWDVN
ncbi:SusD/RagB family nutrient-binding outer membrane lipoprotein [Flavivirga spongiicola]|uniref:SusD/RagB family nutrient-binding outer membrane lipoprotein n=1 Tax=Flavivirga spongiicola TaxID=421621 RepID=A0ABU7XVN9_9FLAO|nr:SusD/RagB family nutrient-binding outer membrane lipoprotein [Flavivirga sp. MEBiC05379]MDO5979578.1 SusD/RagB family nutrient-binding outer membrane lipoprotein [Flavivirga sp. MEBiC05379]